MTDWLEKYVSLISGQLEMRATENEAVITTPFLDSYNDYIQIYADRQSADQWRLTDDGITVSNLEAGGVEVATEKRSELLMQTVNRFGVKYEEPEIAVRTGSEEFANRFHRLVQAVQSVGDLMFMAQPHVENLFMEKVGEWIESLGIGIVRDSSFEGESGLSHKFDFVAPPRPDESVPERIIDAVSSPTKRNIEQVMFSWRDVRTGRGEAEMYAVLNDGSREVSEDKVKALVSYDITPLRWSGRDDYAHDLAA